MTHWLATLLRLRKCGSPSVLVSIVSTKGSVPRAAGTRMVVSTEEVNGTIGGGHLEFSAIGIARDMLAATSFSSVDLRRFPLGASLGQCCGGLVNLLFEPIGADAQWVATLGSLWQQGVPVIVATPSEHSIAGRLVVTADRVVGSFRDPELDVRVADAARALLVQGGDAQLLRFARSGEAADIHVFLDPLRDDPFDIVLFGAGHVGRALVQMLAALPCRVTWVDARESEFPASIPDNVSMVATDLPEEEVAAAPPGAYYLVMTHSHPLDQMLAEAILRRGEFAYFGLIGSVSKRRQFERRMTQRGIPEASFKNMTCPIGVPGIKGKEPATIAVAIAAQLLLAKEARATKSRPAEWEKQG